MDRLACVNVAALPLQILLRANPNWKHLPTAVVESERPNAAVLYLNAQARRAGVRSGQRYAAALSLAKNLQAGAVSASQIESVVLAIADRLRRYSPHVEPSTDMKGVFWLDVQGLEPLYPSLGKWADAVRAELEKFGVKATVAIGFSRFGVYALAKSHRKNMTCEDEAEEQASVQKVLLSRLDLDADVRERLLRLGVVTVGDFLRLPGEGIETRFGAEVDALYQLAAGFRRVPLSPLPAKEIYGRSIEFDEPESNAERLVFVVKRLLDGLVMALAQKGEAIVAAALQMKLQDRTTRTEHIRPAATVDVAQLLGLIYLRLNTVQLTAGIVTLRVSADTCPASADQRRLFQEHKRDAYAANQALARVRAECGEQSVVRARIRDAHLPAARFAWEPLEQAPMQPAPRMVARRPLVRRIYKQPVPLAVQSADGENSPAGDCFGGPYVLSGGWWAGGVHRDYYFLQTSGGEIQWIYYDRRRGRFFLQGRVE